MKKFLELFIILIFCISTNPLPSQSKNSELDLNRPLPVDSKITIGKLENGLTYYIRENRKPENRAELRLAVNAGSVLEDDDQQGLAHFVEHMAFNGTKNFAKQEIVDYLESIGMRFGPDINAYTSFDETVYMLQAPTDRAEILETAFQILEEWAHHVTFDSTEIEKERGVVVEEWRLGRGANARMLDKQLPILFHESRYAQRLPIGQKEILETAPREAFTRFYQDWYRPDLMAVVAVGDFDKTIIEKLIQEHFSKLEAPKTQRERALYPVPDHSETLFAIASDPEAANTSVSIYFKQNVPEQQSHAAYRELLIENLYNSILNNRLEELLQTAEPPFLYGFSSKANFIRPKNFYFLGAAVKEDGVAKGLETLLTEALRVRRHGFTQTELDREKTEMLRAIEQAYNERDKTESDNYAAEYLRNFLENEPLPGIEYEFELYQKFLPTIELAEVNRLASEWITDGNRVVLVSGPEKEGVVIPAESELSAVFESVKQREIPPYVDAVSDQPLVSSPPAPGQISEEKIIPELGVTEWRLSNGVRVILKPTDFKNDQILFTAFSPGGHSLISASNYIAAVTASSLIQEGGLGGFDQIALQKKLAGKIVNVSPWINELQEGLSGNASPQDVETMFQLIYLYFTAPRKDSTAFLSFQSRIKGFIRNRGASPEAAFQDTIQVTMANYHFRARPWTEALLDEMNLETSFNIYRDRFADASDFTFIIVGNFNPDELKPLAATYLGGLPSIQRHESWKDVGMDPPAGVVAKEVKKGLESKSRVSIVFSGNFKWDRQSRFDLNAMTSVLEIKLREVLREDLGGVYGVGVWASTARYPEEEYSINISFGCAPERVEELTGTVFQQIDSLRTFGTTEKYLAKVKEIQRRKRQTDLKENSFWLNSLRAYYQYQENPLEILNYDQLIENLSLAAIPQAAQRYFNKENYVKVVLLPE
jgi:zinc protease